MSVNCILQGQDNSGIKLDGQKFIQEFEDVTQEVKSAVGVDVLKSAIDSHIADKENPHNVTAEQIGAAKESEVGSLYLWEKYQKQINYIYELNNYTEVDALYLEIDCIVDPSQIQIVTIEEIAAAKLSGVQFGRPRKPLPENFEELYQRFRNNEPISRLAKECPQISESTLRLRLQERLTLDKHH